MADEASTRKVGRPADADAAETRRRLIREARRSFATEGYDATPNRKIAEAVGITTAAIYHYFDSKADLYVATYAEVQETVFSTLERATSRHQRFADRFSALLDALAEIDAEDPYLAGFVIGVASDLRRHPELTDAIREHRVRGRDYLLSLCRDAIARGEVSPAMTESAMYDMLVVMLSGLTRFSHSVHDRERLFALTEGLKQVVAGTILQPALQ
jgi:AcrR family transcriptional regulator